MEEHHHDQLIQSITEEYKDILDNSGQAIYIYLGDEHKVCNKKFATLLGYSSENEWAEVKDSFPDVFVAEESQDKLITSFQDAMEKNIGSVNEIVWKKKDGSTVNTTVIIVPVSHDGHLYALHFVE